MCWCGGDHVPGMRVSRCDNELGVIMDQVCGCTGCEHELGVIMDQLCGCTGCDHGLVM